MTAIVGIARGGRVWLGSDSGTYNGDEVWTLGEPKVFRNRDFIFGCAGHGRVQGILKHVFVPPKHPAGQTDPEYLQTLFVDAVREQCDAVGFLQERDGVAALGKDSSLLIGYRGHLFFMEDDLQIGDTADGINATGAGGQMVRAAMYALPESLSPMRRVRQALEAAAKVTTIVSPPFHVISSK